MDKQGATLKDIAEKLNFSISTVSRALKDHPRISDETKEKVLKIALDMNYDPNRGGSVLISTSIKVIGVIVPRIRYHLYATAISGMEDYAESKGYNIMICQSNESIDREKKLINGLMAGRVAGLIVSLSSETDTFDHFQKLVDRKFPIVFFNRECSNVQTDRVIIDNFQAAYEATEHLINTGCKKIAYLGGPIAVQISNNRMEGYIQALKDHNLTVEERLIQHCQFNKESALNAARKLVYQPKPPEGVLTYSDQIALSMMTACKERGLKIPQDISIIGFNDEPVNELLDPPLTSVDQPGYEMGRSATELLMAQIEKKEKYKQPVKRILNSNLIIRKSTNRNRAF